MNRGDQETDKGNKEDNSEKIQGREGGESEGQPEEKASGGETDSVMGTDELLQELSTLKKIDTCSPVPVKPRSCSKYPGIKYSTLGVQPESDSCMLEPSTPVNNLHISGVSGGGGQGCSNVPLSANSLIIHTVRLDLRLARGMSGSQ